MDLSSGLGGLLMEHHHLVLLANSCNLHRNAVIFGSKKRCGWTCRALLMDRLFRIHRPSLPHLMSPTARDFFFTAISFSKILTFMSVLNEHPCRPCSVFSLVRGTRPVAFIVVKEKGRWNFADNACSFIPSSHLYRNMPESAFIRELVGSCNTWIKVCQYKCYLWL